MIRALDVVACPTNFILFYDQDWQGGVFKVLKNYHFSSIFSLVDHFPCVFEHVKEWLLLQLHETIRMSYLVACPNVFILFYEQGLQGGVFKVMKNDQFLVACSFVCILFYERIWQSGVFKVIKNDQFAVF